MKQEKTNKGMNCKHCGVWFDRDPRVSKPDWANRKFCSRPCQYRGKIVNKAAITHGHTADGKISPTYSVWKNMRIRCNSSNATAYKYYGAKGIKVCERWDDFKNFIADMGERPEGMTIDRIDNSGDYTPDNCQWLTRAENASKGNKTILKI